MAQTYDKIMYYATPEAYTMNKYGNYECYIAQTPIPDDKEVCIGACTKDTSKNIIMLIVVAKKGAETDCVKQHKGQTPKCYVSADTARKLQADDQAAVFVVFHELGHVVLGTTKRKKKDRNNNQHKIDALNQGIVDADELAADAFAAEYVGIEDSIKALEESRDSYFLSFQHKILPDKTMPAKAYQEMTLRIEALKNLLEKEP